MDEPDIRMLAARVPTSPQGRYDDGIPEKPAPKLVNVKGKPLDGVHRGHRGTDDVAFIPGPHYRSLLSLRLAPGKRHGPEVTTEADNGSTEATD